MTSCIEIPNCNQTMCVTDLMHRLCVQCNEGYFPGNRHNQNGYPQTCIDVGTEIFKCRYYGFYVIDGVISVGCNACENGFARNSSYGCSPWTDHNCQALLAGDSYCEKCWPGYVFSGPICLRQSVGLAIGIVGLFIGVLFE